MKAFLASRGSLLVMTLWVMVILGALAVAVGRQLSVEVRLARYRRAMDQAETLARSGVLLAMQRLQQDVQQMDEPYDWLDDDWAAMAVEGLEEMGVTGRIAIAMEDAARRLDVNAASAAQLGAVMGSPAAAQEVVDYRDADTDGPSESPVETAPYYYPKNGPVAAIEELRELPGMSQDLFAALQALTAAVPGSDPNPIVNINTASREVLQAVGLTGLADAIVLFREQGHYFTSLSPDVLTDDPSVPPPFDPADTEFQNARATLGVVSHVFTVQVTAVMESPAVRRSLTALIRRYPGGTELPRIVAWREG